MIKINKLGESGKLTLTYAEKAARQLNNQQVGTEHLFLGVIELEDVNIRRQFHKVGVDVDEISQKIRQKIRAGEDQKAEQLFLNPSAKKALETSQAEAKKLGSDTAEAPHILLGVLSDDTGVVARILKEHKVDLANLAHLITEMMRKEEWPKQFYGERKAVEQPGIDKTSDIVSKLGRDLTADAEQGKLDPIIGREQEMLALIKILTGRRKNNPILVGDAGVGKTGVIEGLAQLIVDENVPPELQGKRIRTVEMVAIVSGAQYLGQFEQKLQTLIKEAENNPDLIIFIDEIHTLMGARGGAMNAADILKPALSGGRIKCIGATTTEEYRKYIEKDKALDRRFQPVFIGEPTSDETLEILSGLRPKYEDFHRLKILDEALDAAVELSVRYIGNRRLPDKAIDLIDQACSQKKLRLYYGVSDIGELTLEEKRAIFSGKKDSTAATKTILIAYEDVARIVSEWTGIPVGKLTEKESEKLLSLEKLMKEKIVGQDEGVFAIAQSIRMSRSGLVETKRPIGSFLFLGPTGVGKTELAKTLAAILFDDEERIIQIDMSEFYEKHTISRLIGSPHGYVDSDLGGQLTEAVKKQPYSVVLFDEIEKAHPEVLRILIQVLEEGRLTDGLGRPVNFRNTVVIMTSNIGSGQISEYQPMGFSMQVEQEQDPRELMKDMKTDVKKELIRLLKPEFVNRIDEIVYFNPLSKENLRAIASNMLARIKIKVEADQEVIDFLVNARYDPTMGARPLRRTIEDLVVEPLANEIIKGKITEHDVIKLKVSDGEIIFKKKPVKKKKPKKNDDRNLKTENAIETKPTVDQPEVSETSVPPSTPEQPEGKEPPSGPDPDYKICPGKDCGRKNPAKNKWCKNCGRDLQ